MQRTQIYVTDKEMKAVRSVARRLGKTQSEVIRIAIDSFIERENTSSRIDLLRSGRGLWKDRRDLPDFSMLRAELDRTAGAADES